VLDGMLDGIAVLDGMLDGLDRSARLEIGTHLAYCGGMAEVNNNPSNGKELPRLLRIPTVAEVLAISRPQVYSLIYRGELPCVRIGRSVRVPEAAVRRIAEHGLAVQAD
jgi:excisionase family DNA binding protein